MAQINADPAVRWVDHLGDIKNGSSVCSDEYFALIRSDFDRFADPLVYTIGDNEWTDCHRPNNGAFNPLERLAKLRQVFFARPGHTLGRADTPLAPGSTWLPFYNLTQPAANLTRITIDGSSNATNYLRVTVHTHGRDVLTWTRVPFTTG